MNNRAFLPAVLLCLGVIINPVIIRAQYFVSTSATASEKAEIYFQAALQEPSRTESRSFFMQALEQYRQALELLDGEENEQYVNYCLRTAYCLSKLQDNTGAGQCLNKALAAGRSLYSADPVSMASLYIIVASQCIASGDDVQAYRLLQTSKPLAKKSTKTEVQWLLAMQKVEFNAGRNRRSLDLCNRAIPLARKLYSERPTQFNRGLYVDALRDKAGRLPAAGAKRIIRQAYDEYVKFIYSEFNRKSELSRTRYWSQIYSFFSSIFSFAETWPAEAYDAALLTKGLLLNTSIEFDRHIRESGDSVAIAYLDERDALESQGARTELVDSLDMLIISRFKGEDFLSADNSLIRWQDVRAALEEDDLAVEFYELDGSGMGAVLLRRDWISPVSVRINGQDYWGTIRRYFPRTEKGRVFFSPAGKLNLQAIEYEPAKVPGLDNTLCLADVFNIYRLSSTRELVLAEKASGNRGRKAGIYGGVDYSVDYDSLLGANERAVSFSRNVDTYFEKDIINHTEDSPESLPGTAAEAHAVDSILSVSGIEPDIFTGRYASEEAILQHSRQEGILHFATHGYYVSAEVIGSASDCPRYYRLLFSQKPNLIADPLCRSGLLLAGASHAWLGEGDLPDGLSDGVMTARDISKLDLRGTDLVVLSACDSGLGDLGSDGVYGLPRAFKKAGARTILMSLNQVNDEATAALIRYFYQYCMMGKDTRTAFMNALRALRQDARWQSGEIWQSYILMDAMPDDRIVNPL